MRFAGRHRLLTAMALVLVVLALARLAQLLGGGPAGAALLLAERRRPRGTSSPRRSRRVLALRANGFLAVSLGALGCYVLQRNFVAADFNLPADLLPAQL